MSENYYTSLIGNIEKLIDQQQFQQAFDLINEELSMPYVPMDVEEKLNDLLLDVIPFVSKPKQEKIMTMEEIRLALKGNDENAYNALKCLMQVNIRHYLAVVGDALLDENINHMIKALLIELLKQQQVDHLFTVNEPQKSYQINPYYLPEALEQENIILINDLLTKRINDNPSMLQMCQQTLVSVVYQKYPDLIQPDDVINITDSIVRYVFKAFDDTEGWQKYKNSYPVAETQLEEYLF